MAVAVMVAGVSGFAPLCGMGICFACRVRVDGVEHVRSCQVVVREGMAVLASSESDEMPRVGTSRNGLAAAEGKA